MKIETPLTETALAELKALGQRFISLDHDPERRAINSKTIEFCESLHVDWTGVSFQRLDERDDSQSVKIDRDILKGKKTFEEYWAFRKECDEYDYEYEEYLDAKETYERLKEKYE